MTHLDSDELIDAAEGLLSPERRAHLETCESCRQQLADLSAVLNEAKQASVPDPSPLFWQHFSRRVRLAIDAEPAKADPWPSWLRWQVLAPVGAAAMLILGLMIAVPKPESTDLVMETPDIQDVSDGQYGQESAALDALALIVGDFGVEEASAAGVIAPGVADRVLLELTAEEQQELMRLLKAELTRAKS